MENNKQNNKDVENSSIIGKLKEELRGQKFIELLEHSSPLLPSNDLLYLRSMGIGALITALNSVLPDILIQNHVIIEDNSLVIGEETLPFESFEKLIIVGGGKATGEMCKTLISIIDGHIPFEGIINVPYGQEIESTLYSSDRTSKVEVNFASHPVPDENGLEGVKKMLTLIEESSYSSIVIALISGGGSALLPYPAEGISLEDLKKVNTLLLECGASIDEINCVRKHLSAIKGGYLSKRAWPRRVFSLIISDVIGDDLQTIASGPTVPDLTSFSQAVSICKRYGIFDSLPPSVREHLLEGEKGAIEETPKPDPIIFDKTINIIIGSAHTSAHRALDFFMNHSFSAEIFTESLQGEALEYGEKLVDLIPLFRLKTKRSAFIGTGEFTVTLRGKGRGGRNQEMLLSFLSRLYNHFLNQEYCKTLDTQLYNWVIISAAFDGIEGNSPAMGAIIDSSTLSYLIEKHLDPFPYLENNDSYSFFKKIGATLEVGYTGTNVNDMLIILIEKKEKKNKMF